MAEISSAGNTYATTRTLSLTLTRTLTLNPGNTYATTGGQFQMPMTIIGAVTLTPNPNP